MPSACTPRAAAGLIAVGLFGDRAIRRYGRRRTLRLATAGISAGGSCLPCPRRLGQHRQLRANGAPGGPDPGRGAGVLAETHRDARRDVAYAEANAVSYAFSILGPLTTALLVPSPSAGEAWCCWVRPSAR